MPAETAPAAAQTPQGGTLRGNVAAGVPGRPGGIPLPGAAVTATNTLTGRKYTAATDADGVYALQIPRNGRYVLRVELTGFAAATSEVVFSSAETGAPPKVSNFGLELASRAAANAEAALTQTARSTSLLSGLQNLSVDAGDAGAIGASAGAGNSGTTLPSLNGVGDSTQGQTASNGAESIAVSGQTGQTNGLANFSEEDIRQRVEDAVAQARASGQLPQGGDPTNAIVSMLGGLMAGGGPGGPGGGGPGRGGPGGGGPGGSFGGGGGRGGGGNLRNFNPTQLHGGLNYQGELSALDSAPWSVTLQPGTRQDYARNSFGASLAGSPYIPGLTKANTKQFVFLNFNGQRNTNPEVLNATVPTLAQRSGDLSGLTQIINGKPTNTPIYDPARPGTQFSYGGRPNVIDPSRLSPQALAVLNYYPAPNITAVGTGAYNYQTVTTAGNNSANLAARYVRNLGASAGNGPFGGFGGGGGGRRGGGGNANQKPTLRQNINSSFNYSHAASDLRNVFLPLGGASQTDGYNVSVGYTVGFGRLNNNSTLTWNRSNAETRNYFTDTALNPSTQTGIKRPSSGAIGFRPNFYNGLPTLGISNFTSLSNTSPSATVGQTISFSDFVAWRHTKHNMRFGLDIRRVHQDSLGGNNPLGTFTFTGYATQSPDDQARTNTPCTGPGCNSTAQATTGAAFADFLLGLPQQTRLQAGLSKIYLRENVWDWFVQDDFRVRANLTLNYGLRWEYFAPLTEINNRLVNLTGISTGTTSVGCVSPTGLSVQTSAGMLTCAASDSRSLIHPDRSMYSPRFGFAWRPAFAPKLLKDLVVRGGYGLNYNTGQFATFARSLSYQPPFAATQNNVLATNANPTGCTMANMTLANGFGCSSKLYQNSFAVNPNYQLGMVQVYNLDLQKSLPKGIVLNVGYNGSKGSDLDVTRAPNHTATSVTTPGAVAFTYEDSVAASNFNALTVNARKRLQKGIALGATYQYAHSIDNASSFGGASSTASIQDDARLDLERSNSSFDVRHRLTGNWLYELPVGPNRTFLNKGGLWASALDGFSLSGNFTFTSGQYYTPRYQSTAAQIAAGGTYTLRPDRVFSQPVAGAGRLRSFFNPAAFSFPASSTGYGTASRYSIQGPGIVQVNAVLSRTVRFGETRSFEGRLTANNVFNTVQYNGIDTTLDSATFGQVTGAATMRQITFSGRYRF